MQYRGKDVNIFIQDFFFTRFIAFTKLADSPGSDCENWSSFSETNLFLKKRAFSEKDLNLSFDGF